MKVTVTGIDRTVKALGRYGRVKANQLADETNRAALNVDRGAKRAAPVDTGRLRSSIHAIPTSSVDPDTGIKTGKLDAAVATNVVYAPIQEEKRSYLFSSWEKERPEYIKRVRKVLKSL